MAKVKKFSAKNVALGGCRSLDADCGLTVEDVRVHVSDERIKTSGGWYKERPYAMDCTAKIGSIACEECGLRQVGTIQDLEVEFELRRSTQEVYRSGLTQLQIVMAALPNQLADALFCQRESGAGEG